MNVPEEGIRKTFHHEQMSVWVRFLQGWLTPLEVDGLTVERVFFTHKASEVSPRHFSEAMRNLAWIRKRQRRRSRCGRRCCARRSRC